MKGIANGGIDCSWHECHKEENEILVFWVSINVKMIVISVSEVCWGKWEWREGYDGAVNEKGK